jgi:amidophosphoribosyltransferase
MAMECRDNLNDKWDSGEIGHECGFALLRLLKPIEYYEEKYGTHFFGLNRMYLLMEKQRNRGTDGAGVANVKLDMPPGVKYIHCEKSIDKDPIKDLFERVQLNASKKLATAPPEAVHAGSTDPWWMKEHVPYTGELFMAHVRYGTDSDNSVDRCHPVTRESNWMTRNLLLAGNFNITNNEDLFTSLVNVGQHPRELSDTVMLLERIGHYVDKENNDLYVKYSAMGHAPRTCFSLIAENLNIGRILRLASADWDGGYCIAGMFGHGDAFCLRDPNGIRPAFYLCNDEVIAVASEAPLLQTVFSVGEEQVNPLPAGEALIIRRNGQYSVERVREHRPLLQCSFERIYFSRGNDSGVYREREALGRLIFKPLLKMIEAKGDSIENTVLSFIPNTSELAYNGLVKQAQDDVVRLNGENLAKVVKAGKTGAELDAAIRAASTCAVRAEKVVHKDAKIRTFIQEDSSREHMTLHAYDVHYGTIKPEKDVLVALDDSIVRGNTLKNAILRTLDKQHPKRIIVVSSCPQIRYPDVYGIDMAKMGDLAAFKAAVTLLKERGMENVLPEVYKLCRAELACKDKGRELVNHVKRIYDQFTPDEISAKIAEQVTPSGMGAEVQILFQRIEELHEAMPDHAGDWYFSGNYPTPGGTRVCCRAFVLWMEGSTARCYGVNSAMSCVQTSVLVIGKGGAEHALACKLSHSHEVACVYVAPGNGGTLGPQQWGGESYSSAAPVIPVELSLRQPGFDNVIQFCRSNDVKMVVVGSQACLADGLADVLLTAGVQVFGPSKLAAEIESSNSFAEEFAKRHSIPKLTTNGADSQGQHNELDLSIVTLTDGVSLAVFPYTIQNFKHADQGDSGPVTDGMGAVAPSTAVSQQMLERIEQEIVRPTIKGLQSEGRPFVGCLQVELRITEKGPQVLRFRGTFSDLGAQVALPLLDHNCDLFELLSGCAAGRLEEGLLKVRDNRCVVAVVMTSGGFPGTFQAGYPIAGVDRARCVPGTHVFHNNTDRSSAQNPTTPSAFRKRRSVSGILAVEEGAQTLVTAGGPVLTVAAVGKSISEARERAYVGVRAISFKDCAYRHDIAAGPQTPHRAPLAAPSELDLAPLSPAASPARKDKEQGPTYLSAGVDNAAGAAAQSGFEPLMEKTKRAGCRTVEVPEFGPVCGSFCDMKALGYQDPVLVSASSNVGTKLEVAFKAGKHDTIGIDLVALCANDVAAQGA